VRTGGAYEGQVYRPTILTNVPYEATISNEETFGSPWSLSSPVDTLRAGPWQWPTRVFSYGLVASILTSSPPTAVWELAPKVMAGRRQNVNFVDRQMTSPTCPWGGRA